MDADYSADMETNTAPKSIPVLVRADGLNVGDIISGPVTVTGYERREDHTVVYFDDGEAMTYNNSHRIEVLNDADAYEQAADNLADLDAEFELRSDPFADMEVADGARFAGAGQSDEDVKEARQGDLAAWLRTQTWSDFAQSLADFFDERGYLSPKQEEKGSSMRTKCEAREAARAPKAEAAAANPVTEDGIYKNADGDIFKCVHNQSGSSMYAKQLVGGGDDGTGKYSWSYAAGAIRSLTADMLLTLDEAREFGTITGTCVMCGAYLTNEESIAYGIGPICRGKF